MVISLNTVVTYAAVDCARRSVQVTSLAVLDDNDRLSDPILLAFLQLLRRERARTATRDDARIAEPAGQQRSDHLSQNPHGDQDKDPRHVLDQPRRQERVEDDGKEEDEAQRRVEDATHLARRHAPPAAVLDRIALVDLGLLQ